jgi:hypothetical protein
MVLPRTNFENLKIFLFNLRKICAYCARLNILRRLVGLDSRAQIPPEVIPEPLPTDAERAEQYTRELHAIDAELDAIGERIKEFRRQYVRTVPTRGARGGIMLTERFLCDETAARDELRMVWDGLWRSVSALMKERNRILSEGAKVWAK